MKEGVVCFSLALLSTNMEFLKGILQRRLPRRAKEYIGANGEDSTILLTDKILHNP